MGHRCATVRENACYLPVICGGLPSRMASGKRKREDKVPAKEKTLGELMPLSSLSSEDTASSKGTERSIPSSECKQCKKPLPSSLHMCHACWFNEVTVISQLARFH